MANQGKSNQTTNSSNAIGKDKTSLLQNNAAMTNSVASNSVVKSTDKFLKLMQKDWNDEFAAVDKNLGKLN